MSADRGERKGVRTVPSSGRSPWVGRRVRVIGYNLKVKLGDLKYGPWVVEKCEGGWCTIVHQGKGVREETTLLSIELED